MNHWTESYCEEEKTLLFEKFSCFFSKIFEKVVLFVNLGFKRGLINVKKFADTYTFIQTLTKEALKGKRQFM